MRKIDSRMILYALAMILMFIINMRSANTAKTALGIAEEILKTAKSQDTLLLNQTTIIQAQQHIIIDLQNLLDNSGVQTDSVYLEFKYKQNEKDLLDVVTDSVTGVNTRASHERLRTHVSL